MGDGLLLLAVTCAWGLIAGGLFEVGRRLTRRWRRGARAAADFFFWVLLTAGTLTILFLLGASQVRFSLLLGLALGWWLYRRCVAARFPAGRKSAG
ncbi:MAG: spore cortex biosynthesis protein YabQ [Clostridia bacterium]|jgi:hypothetical protein|nr:hypothetical protein [Clostridia bacterium]MDH7572710.1 spore cortex biosynthesis protein YabQ [Clostridia bacterium]